MDQRESWLFRAAVVYGAPCGQWAMIGFFPLAAGGAHLDSRLAFSIRNFCSDSPDWLRGAVTYTCCCQLCRALLICKRALSGLPENQPWGAVYCEGPAHKMEPFLFGKPFLDNGNLFLLPMLALGINGHPIRRQRAAGGEHSDVHVSFGAWHPALLCAWVALDRRLRLAFMPWLPFLSSII